MSCNTLFGKVPDGWTVSTIGEIAELRQGLQISSKKRLSIQEPGSIPLLKITDLPKGIFSEFVRDIPENYIATKDDIIYTRTGQVGLVYTDVEGCVHNNCFKVIVDYNKFDKYYIYYYLSSPQFREYANKVASGSIQKDLTHKAFNDCVISYPSLDEQKSISSIFRAIDNKISYNNELTKKLLDISDSILCKYIFNFDFKNTQSSEWILEYIENTDIEVIDGDRGNNYPKKNEISSQGYCLFLNNKNLINDRIELEECDFITKEKDELLRKGKLTYNDIVITTRGTIGNVGMYSEFSTLKHVRINSGMIIIRSKDINSFYLYQFLKSSFMKEQYKLLTTGSNQKQLPIKEFKTAKIIIPPKDIQQYIGDKLKVIYKQIAINDKENEQLNDIKLLLYKKLFAR